MNPLLPPALLDRILTRLSFTQRPEPTLENLRRLYAAWCQRVPFDNVRKLIHIKTGSTAPFPGNTAQDFFEAWLRHGTGGTCWANAGACHALWQSLGFDAVRGIGAMMAAPNVPPNHGTVHVRFGGENYLTDCSILHGEPIHLDGADEVRVAHPAWGVRGSRRDGKWHIRWRPLHNLDGLDCRLDHVGLTSAEYEQGYEKTRGWSPFNYALNVRLNKNDCVIGIGFGKSVVLLPDGTAQSHEISEADRPKFLIEEIGLSEEIVSQLPADRPTPPPPGTKTAAAMQNG